MTVGNIFIDIGSRDLSSHEHYRLHLKIEKSNYKDLSQFPETELNVDCQLELDRSSNEIDITNHMDIKIKNDKETIMSFGGTIKKLIDVVAEWHQYFLDVLIWRDEVKKIILNINKIYHLDKTLEQKDKEVVNLLQEMFKK